MNFSSFPVLDVNGPDAATFAHAQFSNDVAALSDGHWQWNAWLNPQGRVRAFFALLRLDATNLRLILRVEDPAALRDALARFVLRSKVTLRVADEVAVGIDNAKELDSLGLAMPKGEAVARNADAVAIAMPGDSRWLVVGAAPKTTAENGMLEDIRAGIPFLAPALQEQALPHWLGLVRLGAVSVKKGCYPGQEITSRMHFKGGNKRSLYRLSFDSQVASEAGAAILAESGERVGQMVMACGGDALAILTHASAEQSLRLEAAPSTALRVHERFD